ncbi:MAG: preprotein translocase subunit SecE [Pseudomonadales bacterium]|jgi:preprotein translocase subunit SecE|uniref:preprotein translocase subunit SecE n=1 Tax=Ketobacter sp. GenoA1 TaxID=2072747 RepID=UPI000C99170F|nr:preprotein translocase subunit SecE [Ketobacter sp. GenoA1]MAQ23707.1 preprotein translocase subunit SecE [Pseudomonadales bacterium]MEC8812125.1 preprotein translocase subunit SecE [Pseudomonadota bacterium]RLT88318.1 MAG: preprotein translocase subunit SecE [Ketobacter sp. GenoA1]TNC85443.1 MAG: preprotein translocase subunit SecE [Alcanivorax sp.]|tara:strand:+ start:204 stop:575 length:372 start_codon:yes stop_codon:yes gene_type:complete
MTTSTEQSKSSPVDVFKWLVVIAIIAAAVVGNAYFDDQPLLYRVVGVVVAGILAALLASFTDKGRAFIALLQDARAEVRRVVWPTKQETAQTTGVVVLVVAIMALLLWLLDLALGKIISSIIG